MTGQQRFLGQHQIGQTKQAEQLRCVLRQTVVAYLAMTKQILDHVEGMLDPRPDLRLRSLRSDQQIPQCAFAHRLDLAALDGNMPLYGGALHLLPLLACIARIAECVRFMTMQQGMRLRDNRFIGGCPHYTMHQPRVGIHADVG